MEWVRVFGSAGEANGRLSSGQPTLLVVGERRICLVRIDDSYYAVQDACTHRLESLSRGKVNHLREIVCPWHSYRFSLETGQCSESGCRDLRTYPLKVDDSGFWIGI